MEDPFFSQFFFDRTRFFFFQKFILMLRYCIWESYFQKHVLSCKIFLALSKSLTQFDFVFYFSTHTSRSVGPSSLGKGNRIKKKGKLWIQTNCTLFKNRSHIKFWPYQRAWINSCLTFSKEIHNSLRGFIWHLYCWGLISFPLAKFQSLLRSASVFFSVLCLIVYQPSRFI